MFASGIIIVVIIEAKDQGEFSLTFILYWLYICNEYVLCVYMIYVINSGRGINKEMNVIISDGINQEWMDFAERFNQGMNGIIPEREQRNECMYVIDIMYR